MVIPHDEVRVIAHDGVLCRAIGVFPSPTEPIPNGYRLCSWWNSLHGGGPHAVPLGSYVTENPIFVVGIPTCLECARW